MIVEKMHCNWKILCAYYKQKPFQSRPEFFWPVCNLQTVLQDFNFLRKENVPVGVLIVKNTVNCVNLIQSLGRFPRLHHP